MRKAQHEQLPEIAPQDCKNEKRILRKAASLQRRLSRTRVMSLVSTDRSAQNWIWTQSGTKRRNAFALDCNSLVENLKRLVGTVLSNIAQAFPRLFGLAWLSIWKRDSRKLTGPTLLIFAATLAACGGGGDSSTPSTTVAPIAPVSPVATVKPTSGILRITGDSTCVGAALGPTGYFIVVRPWPSFINLPGFTVSTGNCVGGRAMMDVMPTWSQQVASDGAAVELIALAINDAFQYSPDVYADYLRTAIFIARAAGKFAILQTPNPTFENRVTYLAQTMRNVGLETHTDVIDVEAFMHSLYGSDLSFAGDRMHPSQPAYAQIGGFVSARLVEILR